MNFKNLITFVFFILFPTKAFSYFDPGSGSYLIQLFIAFIAFCYFFVTNPIQSIKSFINKFKKKKKNETEDKPKN